MWVITELGEMFSAVDSKDDEEIKVVRARDKRSAKNLVRYLQDWRAVEEAELIQGGGTDYEFRVICTRDDWEAFMVHRMRNAHATNVKNAVAEALGKDKGRSFLRAMMETWSIWYSYQEAELRKGKS